jgi:hypothetical protein
MRNWKFPANSDYAGSADRLGITVIGLLALVWAVILLSACSDSNKSATPFAQAMVAEQPAESERARQTLAFAVIDVLEKKLPFIDGWQHLTATEGACDIKAIADVRDWVKTLTDKHIQAEYYNWLDYYEKDVRERMSPEKVTEDNETRRRMDDAQILSQSLPQPPDIKEHCVKLDAVGEK